MRTIARSRAVALAGMLMLLVACKDDTSLYPYISSVVAEDCSASRIRITGTKLLGTFVYIDGVQETNFVSAGPEEIVIEPTEPTSLTTGTHELWLKSTFPAISHWESPHHEYLVTGPPVAIDHLSETEGPDCGMTTVEIHGQNFVEDATVTARAADGSTSGFFDTMEFVSDELIRGITTAHAIGLYDVIVSNPDPDCPSEDTSPFRFNDIPCVGFLGGAFTTDAAGEGPHPVAIGDVSDDGNNDIVVASGDPPMVTVLLGDGAGNFSRYQVTLPDGDRPNAVALATLDGDSRYDAVVAVDGNDRVRVLLQSAGGLLELQGDPTPATSEEPVDVVVLDYDGDGNNDLAAATPRANAVTFFQGNGDGTFNAASEQSLIDGISDGPTALAGSDFFEKPSGSDDVALVSQGNKVAALLWNYGGSGWVPMVALTTAFDPVDIIIADAGTVVDTSITKGDGPDMIVVGKSSPSLAVIYGVASEEGSALADYQITHDLSESPVALASASMMGSWASGLELLIAYETGLVELRDLPDGGLEPLLRGMISTTGEPYALAVGRLDGDDVDDFAIGMASGELIYIYLSD